MEAWDARSLGAVRSLPHSDVASSQRSRDPALHVLQPPQYANLSMPHAHRSSIGGSSGGGTQNTGGTYPPGNAHTLDIHSGNGANSSDQEVPAGHSARRESANDSASAKASGAGRRGLVSTLTEQQGDTSYTTSHLMAEGGSGEDVSLPGMPSTGSNKDSRSSAALKRTIEKAVENQEVFAGRYIFLKEGAFSEILAHQL